MTRRRSLPWIYRWSRPLIGGISIVGAILTAYLTITKLSGGEAACPVDAVNPSAGCGGVLDSPYATVFGLPLSLFGCLAYLAMATFALAPLFISGEVQKSFRKNLENLTWLLLLAGSTAMMVFSGYLMYILFTQLKSSCPYCITSALFSASLFLLTLFGREWEELGQILFTCIVAGMITLIGTLGVYANINSPVTDNGRVIPEPTVSPVAPYGWEITTTSGQAEVALAKHLTSIDAKMYSAYWCPHCFEQKQLFGKEAFKEVTSIECAPDGKNPQTELCQQVGIQSFPTWEIKDKKYPGTQKLEKLAELSGAKGLTKFKYQLPAGH